MNTNDAIKILKDNGLKYTDKRKHMLDIFVEKDKYINAKHIQQQLDQHYPGISFDTVYRNLHLFKDLGTTITILFVNNVVILKSLNIAQLMKLNNFYQTLISTCINLKYMVHVSLVNINHINFSSIIFIPINV